MQREDFYTLIVYALMFVIALFIAFQVVQPALIKLSIDGGNQYVFTSIVIVAGVIINVVLFELGHIFGALFGGYRILSVNFFGICIYRTTKGWKLGFRSFQGLTGETRILANKASASPRLYLFGPSLLVLIEFAVAVLISFLAPNTTMIHHVALIISGVGFLLLVHNIMPFKLDTLTDGYYFVMLSKKVNVEAYNELIRIESLIFEEKPITDIKVFDQITTLTSRVNLFKVYQLIDEKDYDNAIKLIDTMIENRREVEVEVISRAYAQKLYIILLTKPKEEADKFWFEDMSGKERKFISNDLSMESLRAYLLYNGIVTKSESECEFVINRVAKALKRMTDNHRRLIEIKLFKDAYELVVKENPNWSLPKLNF